MSLDTSARLLAAVGSFLVAGVLFAFSSFVIAALADLLVAWHDPPPTSLDS